MIKEGHVQISIFANKDNFQIMDEVSAEKTISMWIHDEGLDAPTDGSLDDYHYKLKK